MTAIKPIGTKAVALANCKTTVVANSSVPASITPAPSSSTPSFSPASSFSTVPIFEGGELAVIEEYLTGYSTDPVLSAFCVSSAFANFTDQVPQTTTIVTSFPVSFVGSSVVFVTTTETEVPAPLPTFVSPCCSSCTLTGNTVQLIYWPTPAPSGFSGSTIVDDDGFTFTSPSIYMVIDKMTAHNLCGVVATFAGKKATISIPAGQLSSIVGGGEDAPTTTVNFEDFNECATVSGLGSFAASQVSDFFRCSPLLIMPTEVTSIDPSFVGCTPLNAGLLDPPSALTRVTALIPSSSPPLPVSTITPVVPPQT
ncbi:hypothetical protein B7463_g11831, partial [Scytalidium lignicola]